MTKGGKSGVVDSVNKGKAVEEEKRKRS